MKTKLSTKSKTGLVALSLLVIGGAIYSVTRIMDDVIQIEEKEEDELEDMIGI